jgi:hypothetical protein
MGTKYNSIDTSLNILEEQINNIANSNCNEKLKTYKEQYNSILSELLNSYTLYLKTPNNAEYKKNYFQYDGYMRDLFKNISDTNNELDNNLKNVNEIVTKLDNSIKNGKNTNKKMFTLFNGYLQKNNTSNNLVSDTNVIYQKIYMNNISLFIGIFLIIFYIIYLYRLELVENIKKISDDIKNNKVIGITMNNLGKNIENISSNINTEAKESLNAISKIGGKNRK